LIVKTFAYIFIDGFLFDALSIFQVITFVVFVGTHFVHRVDGISYSSIEVRSLASAEARRREGFDARNVFRPCFRENLTANMLNIFGSRRENMFGLLQ
jgi:hypothetical protein